MAKGNLFLGQAKGKVGSVVFSRAFGQQITRTKPTSVANPKTIGQNTQRAILATIAKEAALLTPIVDHSFANVTYGAESVRHFRKINMGILRNMLLSTVGTNYNLSAKGANAVPNYLKVSEGNLPAFSSSVDENAVAFYMGTGTLSSDDNVSVSDFKSAYPNIQGGDQLTLVKLVKTAGSLVDGDAIFALKVNRVVFAPNAFEDDSVNIFQDGLLNADLLDLTKTTNTALFELVDGGAGTGIGFTSDADDTYAAALILSRKVNDKWQRSTQYLELCEFDDAADNAAAIASYGASASLSNDTEYLNQADESESSEGVRSAYMNVTTKAGNEAAQTEYVLSGRSEETTIEAAAGSVIKMSAIGFDNNDAGRQPFFTISKGTTQMKVGSGSIDYSTVLSADTAGAWKIEASYADGSKATYNITLTVQA